MSKRVYLFEEGDKSLKSLLGGKGANLAEMKRIGLPVPAGFTISTDACKDYFVNDNQLDDQLVADIEASIKALETATGKTFGGGENPLLVSVRSGAVISMPGMMDTILNLGLNDNAVEKVADLTGNPRFAYDSYRRFIQMFSDVVLGIQKYHFERVLDDVKEQNNVTLDTELTAENFKDVIVEYKKIVARESGSEFPTEPREQLYMAIRAVFDSWNNNRAIVYRKLNGIPDDLGTAVNVQSMVFGNMGNTSGTGVAFTRNPSTGEAKLYGEFLINAQGEDVVAGIRTPKDILELASIMPDVYKQFVEVAARLESHYKDMQDIEFTIENGKLYMLQTRNAKRTAKAAVKVAVDMVNEGVIDKDEAIMRVMPDQLDQLLHPTFDAKALAEAEVIASGLPASPGAATGRVYFNADDVVRAKSRGEDAILVRMETSPEDIEGMVSAEGILTARGGMTSHAAVVARGMGKCCVAGCGEIRVDEAAKQFTVQDSVYKQGEYISIDGNSGKVYRGVVPTVASQIDEDFEALMTWADQVRRLKVRTNADNPKDAAVAVKFGAEGIGLCRTEHMFFDESRIKVVRQMILANSKEERVTAVNKLLPYQREDFVGIFEAMAGRPVTVRLLDPPLHEFLPHDDADIKVVAEDLAIDAYQLSDSVKRLSEFNPMLGHRGCRLGITYPEIYDMQVRAIIEAAIICVKEKNIEVNPEIMIPLVGFDKELEFLAARTREIADELIAASGIALNYQVGTMIEVPRAALTADQIAEQAQFFSFGTNDLTQMTLGFSRDDAGKFIGQYVDAKIFERDPFETIDQVGVGSLVKIAVEKAQAVKPEIKLGICGEFPVRHSACRLPDWLRRRRC